MANALAPAMQGQLRDVGFAKVLYRLATKKERGKLILYGKDTTKTIFFEQGEPQRIDSTDPKDRIGEYLVSKGVIQRPHLDAAIQRQKEKGGQLGDALIAMQVVSPHLIYEALAEFVASRLEDVFAWEDAKFEFHHGEGVPPGTIPLGIKTWQSIMKGLRAHSNPERVEKALERYQRHRIKPLKNDYLPLEKLNLNARELRLVQALVPSRTVGDTIQTLTEMSGKKEEACRIIYLLWNLEHISFAEPTAAPKDDSNPNSTSRTPSTPPHRPVAVSVPAAGGGEANKPPAKAPARPAGTPPTPIAAIAAPKSPLDLFHVDLTEEKLKEALGMLDKLTYFQILYLDREADAAAIKRAYFGLAARLHPDRVKHSHGEACAALAEKIFARISQAYQVLVDEPQRREYVSRLPPETRPRTHASGNFPSVSASTAVGKNSSLPVAPANRSEPQMTEESIMRQGNAALMAGKIETAIERFESLIKTNPERDDAMISLVYARFNDKSVPEPVRRKEAIERLMDIIKRLEPNIKNDEKYPIANWLELAYTYLGHVQKLANNIPEAEKCYKKALAINPRAMSAKQELNLIELRRKRQTPG
ncbi:MAG: Chaperone protein DnaJ [Myxococcota bacterium]|nr:Chaperone protein DnaJ [Myxococcota bacterium]